ncbi:uncharacterized protein LOC143296452 [Babylonia areolata]|uniref:uncharacterized protein LOC143296452 n=1 Tax=Babylonia areolata TaxID=304850 RepID=UPI003FCFE8B9
MTVWSLVPHVVSLLFLWVFPHTLCGYHAEMDIRNVCDRPWVLVFAHSADGEAWAGSKQHLMRDVIAGKEVKVTLLDTAETYQMRLDNVNFRRKEVCAESLGHLAHNGTHVNPDQPRLYMMVCTSGQVHVLEESGKQYGTRQPMYWYTKDLSDRSGPVYSHYVDGSQALGSLQNLWTAGRTMALRAVMRDRGYTFPLHNVAVDSDTGVVTGQSVRHIGQSIRGNVVRFNPSPYLWFSSWSSNGERDNKRWYLGHAHRSRGHNKDRVSLDWYADTCWRVVFRHTDTGYPEFGSVQRLIEEIRNGHRVRLTIDSVTFEASNIRISGEVVTAQVLDAVEPGGWSGPSKYHIKEDTAYHWLLVHTTGKVRSYDYPVGGASRKERVDSKEVTWMVDTRPWRLMLRTEDQGRILEGTPFQLQKAVEQGASIRINLGMDEKSRDFLTEPDNIRIDETNTIVYAQALNHISDRKAVEPDEYELQLKAFHWYLMIDSEGNVRMSAWYVGKNERQYDKRAPAANVSWWANF